MSMPRRTTGKSARAPRRAAVVGAALLLAGSAGVTAATAGVASAASGRPVEVTFDNQSSQVIAACVFGSGGRCTNGGVEAGATAVVADPFNVKQKVKITVFETGTGTPGSVTRVVTADKKLCATVTESRSGSLRLSVEDGAC
jgi:hypothetical protein